MKQNKLNIFYAWLLLLCFMAGQYMVCIHQHKLVKNTTQTSQAFNKHTQTLTEKCYMCDEMHHTAALAHSNSVFFVPLLASVHFFKPGHYNFVSISLILAAGRAPPVIS